MKGSKMRLILTCLCIAVLTSISFAGEPQTPYPLPEDSVKLVAARHAILEIWRGAQVYYQDRGSWSSDVYELVKLDYVKIDSALNAD